MTGWVLGVAYGIWVPFNWACIFWWFWDRRRRLRGMFLPRWFLYAVLGGALQMVPDPARGHTLWAVIIRAIFGQPDVHIATGNGISAIIAALIWLWLRRRDKIRAALRSWRERERAIIAAMVKTMKGRQRSRAPSPLPLPA